MVIFKCFLKIINIVIYNFFKIYMYDKKVIKNVFRINKRSNQNMLNFSEKAAACWF